MSPLTRTLVFATATAAGMWAQNLYTVTTVGTIFDNSGFSSHTANGINKSGQVVGAWVFYTTTRHYQGFLDSGGVLTELAEPATAINDAGQIVYSPEYVGPFYTAINGSGQAVGYQAYTGFASQAFLDSGGVVTYLGFLPGFTLSWANGINSSGQIVGYSQDASGTNEAFLYSGGVMTGLGTLPGYSDSVATAINDSGQIVGYVTDRSTGNSQAFLYSNGTMTGLGALSGDSRSQAQAINNRGQIVGYSSGPSGARAFVYSGGQMYDLDSLMVNLPQSVSVVSASGINDSGQIIANGRSTYTLAPLNGSAYLLTPLAGSFTPLAGRFVPMTPCRLADTRTSPGPFGGPSLGGGSVRSFAIPQSACNVPSTAQAYSLNVTVVPHGPLGYLALWPTGTAQPNVSTLNSYDGNVVANAALVAAGPNGAVSVYVSHPTDVVLDIDGYFDSTAGDSFYPVQPCRVADTRNPAGPLGGPSLSGGETRAFPVLSSPCNLPAAATAYSMNATVVPDGPLGFLAIWPAGQAQPNVSTLNSPAGEVVANAAIVPAGANGAASVYVSNPTDLIFDANGYFAPSGSAGALSFYPVVPCRVADTRNPNGPFGGPEMEAGATRSFAIPAGGCGIPSSAAAYSLNVTVVPDVVLGYLTAWPTGAPQPYVSTLNSWDGRVVANAAIVPAGSGGAISIYVTNRTEVILDVNGYYAP